MAPAGRSDRAVRDGCARTAAAPSPRAAPRCAAGRIMRAGREPSRRRSGRRSSMRSRPRRGPELLPPTSARRSPMRRRSGWRASAPPTSMPTGRRRITSSPMPTRSIRRSSGSTARPVAAIRSRRARGLLHGAMALHLARYLNVPPAALPGEDGDRLDELPAAVGGDSRRSARCLRPPAAGRYRGAPRRPPPHPRSPAGGADRDARPCAAARGCGLSRLPDARGGRAAVSRVGQRRRGPAYPHRRRPLSGRPFADRARRTADGRHRPPADARRRAAPGHAGRMTVRRGKWCPGAGSNHRHRDFQSRALPTELPGRRSPPKRRAGKSARFIKGRFCRDKADLTARPEPALLPLNPCCARGSTGSGPPNRPPIPPPESRRRL